MTASLSPAFKTAAQPHIHFKGQACPYCDQPIPEDRLEEVSGRIEARARERLTEETGRLREQHVRERAQAEAKAKSELDHAKKDAAVREALVREEAARIANETAQVRIAEAQKAQGIAETTLAGLARQLEELGAQSAETIEKMSRDAAERETAVRQEAIAAAENAMREQLAATEEAREAREQSERARTALASRLEAERTERADLIDRMKLEAAEREKLVREEAIAGVEAAMRERLVATEGAKEKAERARSALASQLEAERAERADLIGRMKDEAAERERSIREEVANTVETGAAERIAAAEKAKADAEKGRLAAEAVLTEKLSERGREIEALKEAHVSEINAQREALEKDKITALNAERGGFLKVKMKLEEDLADVQRRLQQKTAHEHGEGAELELFEVLKAAFEGDRIRRVEKGAEGADIIHEIVEDGKVVGKIVYDSKNRGNWKSEYATKLRKDQIAEKAEFAVLSTNKFPKDTRELGTFEDVILASPARVLPLAVILRGQIVVNNELRIGAVERDKKSAELYAFINSPLAGQLLDSVQSLVGKMDDLDADEQKAHQKVWEKRAVLRQSTLKANGDFRFQVRRIIGTADASHEKWTP